MADGIAPLTLLLWMSNVVRPVNGVKLNGRVFQLCLGCGGLFERLFERWSCRKQQSTCRGC